MMLNLQKYASAFFVDLFLTTYFIQLQTLISIFHVEILQAVASPGTCQGYSYAVDWWSLGVTAFELKTGGHRPFEINPKTSVSSAIVIFETSKNRYANRSR